MQKPASPNDGGSTTNSTTQTGGSINSSISSVEGSDYKLETSSSEGIHEVKKVAAKLSSDNNTSSIPSLIINGTPSTSPTNSNGPKAIPLHSLPEKHHTNFKVMSMHNERRNRNSSVDSFSSISDSPSTPSTAGSSITVNSSYSTAGNQFVNSNFTFGSSGSLILSPTGAHSPTLSSAPSNISMSSSLPHVDTNIGHFSMPLESHSSASYQNLSIDTSHLNTVHATKITNENDSTSSLGALVNGINSHRNSTPGSVLSMRSVGSNISFVTPSPNATKTQNSPAAISSSVSFSKGATISDPTKGTEYYHHEQNDDFNIDEMSTFKEIELNQDGSTSDDDGSSHRDSIDTNRKSVELLLNNGPIAQKSEEFHRERLWKHFSKTNLVFGVFNLINDVLSPATISSGYTVAQSGIGGYVISLLIFASLIFFTLIILYDMANAHKVTSFPSLIKKTFGNVGYILICVFIFLFNFGAVCSELIEMSQILPDLLSELIGKESIFISRHAVLVYVTIILLPIASMKQLSSFKYASFVSVTSVLVISLLLTYELGLGRRQVPYNESVFDFFRPQYMSAMGTISFVFVCHDVSFEVIGSLKNNNRTRYMILVFSMLVLAVGVLLFMGLSSFLLFFDVNLKDANVLDLLPKSYGLAILARILLCVSLGLSISYTCFMPRFAIKSVIKTILKQFDEVKQQKEEFKAKPFIIGEEDKSEITNTELTIVSGKETEEEEQTTSGSSPTSQNTKKKHVFLANMSRFFSTRTGKDTLHYGTTLLVVLSAFAVAMLVNNLGVIIGLTGAISATSIAFIFPSFTYIILDRRERKEMMAKLLERQDYEMVGSNAKKETNVKLSIPWTKKAAIAISYVVLIIGFGILVLSLSSIIYYAVN